MSYQKSVRRITVPLGCTEHINIARDNFKSCMKSLPKYLDPQTQNVINYTLHNLKLC